MHLYLSTNRPWNATYSNTEGQAIYKAESPENVFNLGTVPITIKRILPSEFGQKTGGEADRFGHLAAIEYRGNSFLPSLIRYNGIEIVTNEFFRKTGLLWNNRVFKGPDGKEYQWHLGSTVCKLYLNDTSKALVASYHRRKLGFIGDPRPASLEICPQGQHMTDLIVITFIFVEKLRRDSEAEPTVMSI